MSSPLRRAGFRRLWLAGLISDTGDWLLLVSLPILVLQRTGSALGTSVAFLIELAPGVLVAPLAGRLADRRGRRRVLVVVSLVQAAALLPLLAGARLPVIYAVIAVQAGLAGLFDPAKNALLPTLVEADQLVAANSLVGLNQNLGRLVGAGAGGVLLAVGALPAIVLADAVSFLAATILLVRVPPGRPVAGAELTVLRRGSDGDVAVPPPGRPFRRRPVRLGLAVLSLTSLAQGVFLVLFVVFVARVLHGGPGENGLLRGVQAIGAVSGGLVLARTGRRGGAAHGTGAPRLAGAACLAFGLLALLTWNLPVLTTAEPLYAGLFVAAGVPAVGIMTGLLSTLQESTSDGERGRVFAAAGVAGAAGQATGMLAAGLLGDRFGAVPVLDGQATVYLLAGTVALVWLRAGVPRTVPRSAASTVRSAIAPG